MITVIQTRAEDLELRQKVMAKVIKEGYTAPLNYPEHPGPKELVVLNDASSFEHTYRYTQWIADTAFDRVMGAEDYLIEGSR